MTPVLFAVAGIALLALTGLTIAAVRERRRPYLPPAPAIQREPETEPPRLLVRLVRHLVRTVRARSQPDGIAALLDWTPPVGPASAGHVGATEEFGIELRALRDVPACAELETGVEAVARVHAEFDQVMSDFRHDLDHVLDGVCQRLDPLWARVDAPTGEYPVVAGVPG